MQTQTRNISFIHNNKWSVRFFVSVVLCLTSVSAGAETVKPPPSPVLSLKQAVQTGLYSNPGYKEARNVMQARQKQVRQARASYFPSLNLSGDAGYENTKNSATDSGNQELFRRQITINLDQIVFDGFQTQYEVSRQKGRAKAASFDLYETSEQTALDIINAYISVSLQRDLLRIAQENVERHEDILFNVQQSTRAGRTSKVDVDQVSARLASAKTDLANTQEELDNARSEFKRLTGRFPGKLNSPHNIPVKLDRSLEDHVQSVLINSPAIQSARADVQAAQSSYKQTIAPFLPSLNLQASAREARDIGGIEGEDKNASAVAAVNWNLYNGGEDLARRKEFEYRLAESQAIQAQTSREIEDQVRSTWSTMLASEDRMKNFSIQAESNEKLVSAYLQQFNLNRRTLLDVLDVQSELFRSQSNVANEQSEKLRAMFSLLALDGRLIEYLGLSERSGDKANPYSAAN